MGSSHSRTTSPKPSNSKLYNSNIANSSALPTDQRQTNSAPQVSPSQTPPPRTSSLQMAERGNVSNGNGSFHSQHPQNSEKIQAWGYEMTREDQSSEERLRKKELRLWLIFFILLGAVVFFSQRSWLNKIFPIQKHPHLNLSVEVLRKAPESSDSLNFAEQNFADKDFVADSNLNLAESSPSSPKAAFGAEKKATKNKLLQQFDKLLRLDNISDNPSDDKVAAKQRGQSLQATPKNQNPTRDVRLFFVKVEEDGQLQLTGALHKVPFDKTPLSQTLDKLLKGPETQEINKGLHSMLPPEMQILRIRVVGNTVFLDLSAEFYSIMHLPAVLFAAIEQLVFTVTEFPAIKSLRLLVEGQPIFPENLPSSSLEYLRQQNINLNSELMRENLWGE